MAIVGSLVFLTAVFLTGYALYATFVPALPHINELMSDRPMADTPRMIRFGVDRRTARLMEQDRKLVTLRARNAAPIFATQPEARFRHAA